MTDQCKEEFDPAGVNLHLGCGIKHYKGWVNIDSEAKVKPDVVGEVFPLDYADASVDTILAVHLFEHLFVFQAEMALKDWLRVLKKGGRLILELPNIIEVCKRLIREPTDFMLMQTIYGDQGEILKTGTIAHMHKWGYDPIVLESFLRNTGFSRVDHEPARYHYPWRDMRVVAWR